MKWEINVQFDMKFSLCCPLFSKERQSVHSLCICRQWTVVFLLPLVENGCSLVHFKLSLILQARVKNVSFFMLRETSIYNFFFISLKRDVILTTALYQPLKGPFLLSKVYCVAMAIFPDFVNRLWKNILGKSDEFENSYPGPTSVVFK